MGTSEKKIINGIRFGFLSADDPYELGLTHGKLFKKEINELIEGAEKYVQKRVGFIPRKLLFNFLFFRARRFQDKFTDEMLEEMRGISDGSGISANYTLAAGIIYEIAFALEKHLHLTHQPTGCSAFIGIKANKEDTIFAKTTDFGFPEYFTQIMTDARTAFVYNLRWKNRKFITLSYPIAFCGDSVFTESGLGIGFNDGGFFERKIDYDHYPILRIMRECAETCDTPEQVQKKIDTLPSMKPYTLLTTDGKKKNSFLLDFSHGEYEKYEVIHHVINTNHFKSSRMINHYYRDGYKQEDDPFYHNTQTRYEAINKRIKPFKNIEDVLELIKYHTDDFDWNKGSISNFTTVQGFVFDSKNRELHLPEGNQIPVTYYGKWNKFKLDDLFDHI